jgi:CRISPR-associated protein Cmr4
MTSACLMYLHALSPLHMGSGVSEGTIDRPHAREAHTGLPVLPGSGIKGVLRDEFAGTSDEEVARQSRLFGGTYADSLNKGASQGGLMFGDGALLCLPVRSLLGTFAWVTSPYLLQRYNRDRQGVSLKELDIGKVMPANDGAVLCSNSVLAHQHSGVDRVYLFDLDPEASRKHELDACAQAIAQAASPPDAALGKEWCAAFQERLVVVSDEVLLYFCDMALEVRARVRLEDDTKLVRKGHLWYEESLPAETLAYAVVAADPVGGQQAADTLKDFTSAHRPEQAEGFSQIQLGGNATVGRGWVRTALQRAQG